MQSIGETIGMNTTDPEAYDANEPDGATRRAESSRLVRLIKPVTIVKDAVGPVETSVVSPRFYNAFNYSMIAGAKRDVSAVLGVTSPNRGEGKTTVAANLAVSLATVNERSTVLIDLSIARPVLNRVFGTRLYPGLTDALQEPMIRVFETRIPHLYVLPAGKVHASPMATDKAVNDRNGAATPSFGLEHVAEFRNVIYSLKQEFDYIIIDMPAAKDPTVPTLLTHLMDGLLIVVDTNRTRQEDIEPIFRRIHEKQIIGFVFNRVADARFR